MSKKSELVDPRSVVPMLADSERWRKKAEEMTFYGVAVADLSRDDLLAVIGHQQERIDGLREDMGLMASRLSTGGSTSALVHDKDKSRPKAIAKRARPTCMSCDSPENVIFGPDPFVADLEGDFTPVHLCVECRDERVRAL